MMIDPTDHGRARRLLDEEPVESPGEALAVARARVAIARAQLIEAQFYLSCTEALALAAGQDTNQ